MSDDLITRSFLEIEKYLTLNEKDYENTPALDSEEKEDFSLPEEQQNNTSELPPKRLRKSNEKTAGDSFRNLGGNTERSSIYTERNK